MTAPAQHAGANNTSFELPSRVVWFFLAVQPPLSLAYLWTVRAHWLPPSFLAPVALAVPPLGVLGVAVAGLRSAASRARVPWMVAFAVALLELAWCVLVAAMVGFALALRSG